MKEKLINYLKLVKDKNFLITISFFTIVQPLCFLIIKIFQNDYHTFNTVFDNNIPFVPYFIYIYNLFYFFVIFSFYYIFCKDKKKYYQGALSSIIATIICYIIYVIYPVEIIRPEISNNVANIFTTFILKVTYYFDTPAINCFPSIHCLFCFQIIFTTINSKNINIKNKTVICIISFLIALSTLLVKQHYVYDMLSALILSFITNLIVILIKLDNKIFKY